MAQSKNSYVPPSVQRAMDAHMQRMPANLQKYQSGNTYIPQKAAKSMTSYMEKSMPAHMKQYITPYMNQKVTAGLSSLDPVRTRPMQERAPVPNLMRRDHSGYGEQFTVNLETNGHPSQKSLSYAPQYSPANNTPPAPPPAPMPQNNSPYDFIMSPQQKSGRGFNGNFKQRLIIVAGGGLLLLIAAIIFISVIGSSGKSGTDSLISLAQQQNEIVRVAELAESKATDSATKNFAVTTQLSVKSAQTQVLAQLGKSGHKLKPDQLALKQNGDTDKQLDNAATAGNFDKTFEELMQKELAKYRTALQSAYTNASSTNERQLLEASFTSASNLLGPQKTT